MRPASSGSLLKSMPGHDVRRAEGDLLGLREEIVRIAVEHHPADRRQRHQLLRDDLGRVEHVEAEALGVVLGEHLHAQAPIPG